MAEREKTQVMITDLHDALLAYGTINKLKGTAAVIDFDLEDEVNRNYQGERSGVKGYISSTSDEMNIMYLGRQVLMKILDNQRGVIVQRGVITYSLKGLVHIESLAFVENVQRRNNVKVKVHFKTEIYPVTIVDLGFNEEITKELSKKKPVLFCDISAGGCCFMCKSELSTEQLYQFSFNRVPQPFDICFKVLRCSEIVPNKEWSYGCQFQRMTVREEMLIRQYVFKELASVKKIN